MTALSLAKSGYGAANAPTRTPRSTEYDVLAKITNLMVEADKGGAAKFPALAEALQTNKRLWNIFAVEAANPDNPLPKDLRARLFYLAEFTHHHTSRVLARQDEISPLVDINRAIMRGLRGEGV